MMSKEAKRAIIAEGSFIEWLWQDSAGTLEKVKLIHRLDVRSEKQIHRQLLADLERVVPLPLPINQELPGLSWCNQRLPIRF
jgi:hypothetical protein